LSSNFVSKGPKSATTLTEYLPLKFSGTRHEYRQVPLQPYANVSGPISPILSLPKMAIFIFLFFMADYTKTNLIFAI
jgi:hypothetical protein